MRKKCELWKVECVNDSRKGYKRYGVNGFWSDVVSPDQRKNAELIATAVNWYRKEKGA